MNILLLDPSELNRGEIVRLDGRRAVHVVEVLRARPGDELQVGVLGGKLGGGVVLAMEPGTVTLRLSLYRDPPARAPIDLLLAVPRPKVLRRVLQAASAMGVGRIVLLGTYRVEKSYFSSPFLNPANMEAELRLGLEQGRDTLLPEVLVRRRFKPFVEDELPAIFDGMDRLLAHPVATTRLEELAPSRSRAVIAIGPEGGWTPYEAGRLSEQGFVPFTVGPRPLRVETIVPYLAGQVDLWLRSGSHGHAASDCS